jgi:hypothetical protein
MEALVDGDLQTTLRALPDRLDRLLTTGDAVSPPNGGMVCSGSPGRPRENAGLSKRFRGEGGQDMVKAILYIPFLVASG